MSEQVGGQRQSEREETSPLSAYLSVLPFFLGLPGQVGGCGPGERSKGRMGSCPPGVPLGWTLQPWPPRLLDPSTLYLLRLPLDGPVRNRLPLGTIQPEGFH